VDLVPAILQHASDVISVWGYTLETLAIQTIVILIVTILAVRWSLRRGLRRRTHWLEDQPEWFGSIIANCRGRERLPRLTHRSRRAQRQPDSTALSQQRADAVREVLIRRGVSSNMISARGLGNTHPLTSNRTAAGREENQRVEIVVSADAIGSVPVWDKTYSLTRQ
jgi:hypothetical protein